MLRIRLAAYSRRPNPRPRESVNRQHVHFTDVLENNGCRLRYCNVVKDDRTTLLDVRPNIPGIAGQVFAERL